MASQNDAIASKSTFLASYMSQHVDTLVAYILFYLQAKSWAGGASAKEKKEAAGISAKDVRDTSMLSISSKEMVLQYRDARQGKKAELKRLSIPFDPPMLTYEEVRPRLLQMKTEAEEGIGMIKKPIVTAWRKPSRRNGTIVLSMLLLWLGAATQEIGTFARIRDLFGGWWTIRATGLLIATLHAGEAAFQFRSCQRYNMPLQQTLLWTLTTFVFGFASLLEFRKVVREARIDSIGKSQ